MVPIMETTLSKQSPPPVSSRILDIPCKVCGDNSSGKHYNIFACDGCAGFFKRSIRRNRQYVCKARDEGTCIINKLQRNQCRACRLTKCQAVGMNKDAVQHERGPRNSTLRRQHMAAQLFGDSRDRFGLISNPNSALDLVLPKPGPMPPMQPHFNFFQNIVANSPHFPFPRLPFLPHIAIPPAFIPPPVIPSISEVAASLILRNIGWAKSVRDFVTLPRTDQLLLLEESWRELFIISAAKNQFPLDINLLIEESGFKDRKSENQLNNFVQDVKEFINIVRSVAQFQLDDQEYIYVKTLVLFKTNFDRQVSSSASTSSNSSNDAKNCLNLNLVSSIQDESQVELSKYISAVHPNNPVRFGKLLMLLPTLRSVSNDTIEDLFLRKAIGPCPFEAVIRDMCKDSNANVL